MNNICFTVTDHDICHTLHWIFHQSLDWVLIKTTNNNFVLSWKALIDALDIPVIGGLAESRYLSMDKLKTRGVLLAYKNVSIVEGKVYNKGNL